MALLYFVDGVAQQENRPDHKSGKHEIKERRHENQRRQQQRQKNGNRQTRFFVELLQIIINHDRADFLADDFNCP